MCSRSAVSSSLRPPWTVAHHAPLFVEFSRQEYWSGLPFPSPGDLPDPGIKPRSLVSPALVDRFFTTSTIWKAGFSVNALIFKEKLEVIIFVSNSWSLNFGNLKKKKM